MHKQLDQIKNRLINIAMISIVVLLIPVLFASVYRFSQIGWHWIFSFHILLAILSLLVFAFRSQLSSKSKTHFIAIFFLTITFVGAIQFGLSSTYYNCLIAAVFTILIFGKRTGIIYFIITIVGLSIIAILHVNKILPSQSLNLFNSNYTSWIDSLLTLSYIFLTIVFSIGLFYDFYNQNIIALKQKTDDQEFTQKALQKSEERYRLLVNNVAFPILVSTEIGVILFMNTFFEDILGIDKNDSTPLNTLSFWVNKEERTHFIHELQQNGVVNNQEIQIYTRDNGIKTVLISSNKLMYEGQNAIFSIFNDITERKRTIKKLHETQIRLHTLINTIPDLIWLKDSDGVYLQCNKRFEDLYGAKEKNIIGKTDYDFVAKDLADFFRQHDNNAMFAGKATINEELLTFADGHQEYIETIKTPIYENAKKLVGVLGIGRDITERKDAELKLAESQLELSAIIESTTDLIWTINVKDLSLKRFNSSFKSYFEENFGISAKSGNLIEDLLPSDRAAKWYTMYYEVLKTGAYSINYDVITNGKTYNFSFFPLKSDNEIVGITTFGRDVTELVNAEVALKKSEANLQNLLQSLSDYMYSVMFTNESLIETKYGEGCFTVTGYSALEFETDPKLWTTIVFERDKELVQKHFKALLLEFKTDPIEYRIVRKDGVIRWIKNILVIRYNINGDYIGFDGLITDITEKKILEQQILNSVIETEEKERLHISQELHDGIGPLLSASKMYIQWLARQEKDEKRNTIINDIEKLLDESMDTIREMSFKLSPHILQNFGLHEAINALAEKIQESSAIAFDVKLDDFERIDEKIEIIIYRVLCECINNSIKHSKASNITICLSCKQNVLTFEYADNGKGFDYDNVIKEYKGIGLLNMQSRIKSINGLMDLKSNETEGTSIKISINL
jgi:PAS domain S-box-containing protein